MEHKHFGELTYFIAGGRTWERGLKGFLSTLTRIMKLAKKHLSAFWSYFFQVLRVKLKEIKSVP